MKQLWLEKEGLNIFEVRRVKSASENVAPNVYYCLPVAKAQHLGRLGSGRSSYVTPSSNSNVLPCCVSPSGWFNLYTDLSLLHFDVPSMLYVTDTSCLILDFAGRQIGILGGRAAVVR